MARRHGSGLARLLAALALGLAACTPAGGAEMAEEVSAATTTAPPEPTSSIPTTTTSSTTTSTTTSSTTTTTTVPTTSTTVATTTTIQLPDIGADVRTPEGVGPFPAVVLVHGGGWVGGDPSNMGALARHLSDEGFLTVNTPYQLANSEPGFPAALDDVACAVRYAAAHPESDGSVAVVGHSAGAHLSAVVALTGDEYGSDCPIDGTGVPDKLVGLAGPFDVERLGIVMLPFFGAGPAAEPEAWLAGNPQLLTDENPDIISLIMYGENDGIVDSSFAIDFHDSLISSGSVSQLELVEAARHNEMKDPDFVGDLIVVWLQR